MSTLTLPLGSDTGIVRVDVIARCNILFIANLTALVTIMLNFV